MQEQTFVQVHDGVLISTVTGFLNLDISAPIVNVPGNTVTLGVLVINTAAVAGGQFVLHGSYDGRVWTILGTVAQSTVGYNSVTCSSVKQPFVRVAASVAGSNAKLLYSTYLSFSCQ